VDEQYSSGCGFLASSSLIHPHPARKKSKAASSFTFGMIDGLRAFIQAPATLANLAYMHIL